MQAVPSYRLEWLKEVQARPADFGNLRESESEYEKNPLSDRHRICNRVVERSTTVVQAQFNYVVTRHGHYHEIHWSRR